MIRKPDITGTIKLARSDQGSRSGAVLPGAFGRIMVVDGHNHDIRVYIDHPLAPGEGREVGIDFLDPAGALAHVRPGMAFSLRDWQEIGTGAVVAVSPEHAAS